MNNVFRLAVAFGALVTVTPARPAGAEPVPRAHGFVRTGSIAQGRKAPRPARPRLGADALDKVRDLLAGNDQEVIAATAKALGESAAPNAALPLVEMLVVGTRPSAAIAALDALKKLHDPMSIEILTLYAGNRGATVRRQAVRALGAFSDTRVVPTLMDRLGDTAPDVRAAAADALAVRGEKAAAPRLLALLKHNDGGAAAPLGTIAPVAMLPAITELQGGIDDGHLATTLGEMVKRHDVAEPLRLDIVKTLARIPGAASTTALVEYVGTLAGGDAHASKIEAQKIIDDRSKQ
ncbi:MAG: HEAT repeat domain-containing protein [Pseudomonadota bacterium]